MSTGQRAQDPLCVARSPSLRGTDTTLAWRRAPRPSAQTNGHVSAGRPNGETRGSGREQAGPGGRPAHVPKGPRDAARHPTGRGAGARCAQRARSRSSGSSGQRPAGTAERPRGQHGHPWPGLGLLGLSRRSWGCSRPQWSQGGSWSCPGARRAGRAQSPPQTSGSLVPGQGTPEGAREDSGARPPLTPALPSEGVAGPTWEGD